MNIGSVSAYDRDVAILKKYGKKFKLSLCKSVRRKGFEIIDKKRITGINSTKLENNISRTKSKVFEYAYCNEFDYFVTLTINPAKYDRFNLSAYYKDFSQWLQNYKKKYKTSIKYLFIPEMHQDGAWHLHGFMSGIIPEQLVINEHGYLDWELYKNKFGWISLDKIRNQEACSKYITKYVNKDLEDSIKDLNAHMYYPSKGLKRAVEVKRGTLLADSIPSFDFENDYVKIQWFNDDNIAKLIIE